MMDRDDDTTIGMGGWALVVLSGVITFAVLRGWLYYHFVPAGLFSVAIALIVMLVLYRLAVAVNRYEDEEEGRRVRKVVPAMADVGIRIAGPEGATAPAARAVPVRPEAKVVPQRPSAVVTPLAAVEAPPVILPPAAVDVAEVVQVPEAPATKPKAKPKAAAKPKAEQKPKASKAKAPAGSEAKPKTAKAAGAKAAGIAAPQGLVRLTAPRNGKADNLQEIEGIGPALEKMVNSLGFYHFDQIAAWTEADLALVDAEMKTFKGRIKRDRWVDQAKIIVSEGLEAFRERAGTNDY
jgi:predicted flap endonuclease-1-like 5' DNA nuclease